MYTIIKEHNGEISPIDSYQHIEEALNKLYKWAKNNGYEMTINNDVEGAFGFCWWQIQVVTEEGIYKIYEENEDDIYSLL